MKKVRLILIPMLLVGLLMACAGNQATPQTEQDQARVMLGAFQDSLNIAFDAGKIYVNAHPEKKLDWQTKVIPMFDVANKILKDLVTKGKAGTPITVAEVNAALNSKIGEINTILLSWGVPLKNK